MEEAEEAVSLGTNSSSSSQEIPSSFANILNNFRLTTSKDCGLNLLDSRRDGFFVNIEYLGLEVLEDAENEGDFTSGLGVERRGRKLNAGESLFGSLGDSLGVSLEVLFLLLLLLLDFREEFRVPSFDEVLSS